VFPELNHPYRGRDVVLTSKHQKHGVVAPHFFGKLAMNVVELDLDTDQFGTFSGEKPRTLSQYEAAVAKARLGVTHSGISLGIASEGAIGADFQIPLLNSDVELLVFVDLESDLVIAERYRSFEITAVSREVIPGDDLSQLLMSADFPRHALIVRTEIEGSTTSIKGITEKNQLIDAIEKLSRESDLKKVIVESDLRAHFSPSRRENIAKAAELLAARVAALCPECQTPGWGRTSYELGVPCMDCGLVNGEAVRREILGCTRCEFSTPGEVIATTLDPARCMECNP
jgi:hypothetical protein